jgi:hypothetical protein
MKPEDWIKNNRATFDSEYEALFAKQVLPLVEGLKWETVTVQHLFVDSDGRNRYCDFTIIESQSVRVAIEIDGYDKRGTGSGMTHTEFLDWQRRQASLASQGWYVLRFANRDVRDAPQLCAKHITTLLNRLRQAQGGHIEIVTIQPIESGPIDTQIIVASPQTREAHPKKKLNLGLIAGLFCLGTFALWQTYDTSDLQGIGIRAVQPADQTNIAPKSTPLNALRATRVYGALDCKNPQDWAIARQKIGQVVTVIGPLLDTRPRSDITGSPLWMDVGKQFPEKNRLTVVVWGQNWNKFDMRELDVESWVQNFSNGQKNIPICIKGKVTEYKGIPQIELTTPDQIRIGL